MRSKKDWSKKDLKVAHEKLNKQAFSEGLKRGRWHSAWTQPRAFEQTEKLWARLADHGVTPCIQFGSLKRGDIERDYPEMAGELLAIALMNPDKSFKDLAEIQNLPRRLVANCIGTIKKKYPDFVYEVKKLHTRDIIEKLEEKISMAFAYMDDEAFRDMHAKDLGILAAVMIDKRQLLQGEPTQILSVKERANLNELLPGLILETQRRQTTLIEGERIE